VAKRWVLSDDGRTVLIESVEYVSLLDQLLALRGTPDRREALRERARQWSVRSAKENRQEALRQFAASNRTRSASARNVAAIPKRRLASRTERQTLTMAQAQPDTRPGVVIDWTSISGTSSSFRFQGDTTYYVSGAVSLGSAGNVVIFEGGTVIKYAPTNSAALTINGPITWEGTAYRPVILTARDDQSAGETITNLTASGYYAQTALYIDGNASGADAGIPFVRIAYAKTAIQIYKRAGHSIRHAQFVNCERGVRADSAGFLLRNALFHNVLTNLSQIGASTGRCEHVTVNTATRFNDNLTLAALTNSILAAVGTPGTFSSNSVSIHASATGVFQTVGSASNYLAAGSPERDAGTTAINSALLRELGQLTTEPPEVLAGAFTIDTTLVPRARRDTDTPDRGYHYVPLDYCWKDLTVTNATLRLADGVAIGIYDTRGMSLKGGARLVSEGRPGSLNHLTRYSMVQEQPVAWGATSSSMTWMSLFSGSPNPTIRLVFSDVSLPAGPRSFVDNLASSVAATLGVSHSQLRGVELAVTASSLTNTTVALTNNLLDRSSTRWTVASGASYSPFTLLLYNNFFYKGTNVFNNDNTTYPATWIVRDNLFFSDSSQQNGTTAPTADHNGFRSGLSAFGSNNKTGILPDYASGPAARWLGVRGGFYYPASGVSAGLTNLYDAGSRGAGAASLYHFTTRATSGTSEGSTTVDIGHHYGGVARVVFVGADTAAQGNWKGVHGADGYQVILDSTNHPTYATVSASGKTDRTWASSTSDTRALERESSDRIAAAWYSTTSFDVTLTLSDDLPHRVAVYCLDWDSGGRVQTVAILDPATSNTLDSRTLSEFAGGQYLGWDVAGSVVLRFTKIAGTDAVVSGLFFGPATAWPQDTDGDGLANDAEDLDGDGTYDPADGETDWTQSSGGASGSPWLTTFTPLR
jgi:hypothetical protein